MTTKIIDTNEHTNERWKQRFQNFEKCYLVFEKSVNRINKINPAELKHTQSTELNELEKSGVVRQFGMLVELSWKVMSDYLKSEGLLECTPKNTIRHAFQNELIEDGETWMIAIEKSNKISRTYDSEILEEILQFANEKFHPLARDLHIKFKAKL